MRGKIKHMIDSIIEKRAGVNPGVVSNIRVKMIMKGIYPDKYSENSEDDPVIIEKLQNMAKDLNIII